MRKLPIGLLSLSAAILAVASAFTEKPLGISTYHWYRNTTATARPTPAQIVAGGSFLVNANVSGTPSSNFSDGSSTFTPSDFEPNYVPVVCPQEVPNPICLMLVKRQEGVLQSTAQIVIDGKYTALP